MSAWWAAITTQRDVLAVVEDGLRHLPVGELVAAAERVVVQHDVALVRRRARGMSCGDRAHAGRRARSPSTGMYSVCSIRTPSASSDPEREVATLRRGAASGHYARRRRPCAVRSSFRRLAITEVRTAIGCHAAASRRVGEDERCPCGRRGGRTSSGTTIGRRRRRPRPPARRAAVPCRRRSPSSGLDRLEGPLRGQPDGAAAAPREIAGLSLPRLHEIERRARDGRAPWRGG